MSNEKIKEGMGNVSGGSDLKPKEYPEIIIRSVKYGGPRIDCTKPLNGRPALRPVKSDRIIKPLVTEKSKHSVQPLIPKNSEKLK